MRPNATRIKLSAIPCRRERSNDSSNCTNVYFSSAKEMCVINFVLPIMKEHGLVIVGEDEEDEDDNAPSSPAATKTQKKALVSSEVASLLEKAGEGSLGKRCFTAFI
jgi:LRRFIP family